MYNFLREKTIFSQIFIIFASKFNIIKSYSKAKRLKSSKWCSNVVQTNLNTLVKVCKLLDVDVKDLLNNRKGQDQEPVP